MVRTPCLFAYALLSQLQLTVTEMQARAPSH